MQHLLLLSAVAAGAWGLGLVVAACAQDRLIFGTPRARRCAPPGPHVGHQVLPVQLAPQPGVVLQGWLTLPTGAPRHVAVWFGGRNEHVAWTSAIASWLGPSWAVCAFSYRGCAGSTGVPGEAVCVQDALAIVAWLHARTGVPPVRMLLLGRSLGSGVAVQAAARAAVGGLVLLSPPASLRRLVMRHPLLWPAGPWLRHPFDSLAVALRLNVPSLVLLAERDGRVPHRESRLLARSLQRAAPGPAADAGGVVTIAGTDHRSLARHAATLDTIARYAERLQLDLERPAGAA